MALTHRITFEYQRENVMTDSTNPATCDRTLRVPGEVGPVVLRICLPPASQPIDVGVHLIWGKWSTLTTLYRLSDIGALLTFDNADTEPPKLRVITTARTTCTIEIWTRARLEAWESVSSTPLTDLNGAIWIEG